MIVLQFSLAVTALILALAGIIQRRLLLSVLSIICGIASIWMSGCTPVSPDHPPVTCTPETVEWCDTTGGRE